VGAPPESDGNIGIFSQIEAKILSYHSNLLPALCNKLSSPRFDNFPHHFQHYYQAAPRVRTSCRTYDAPHAGEFFVSFSYHPMSLIEESQSADTTPESLSAPPLFMEQELALHGVRRQITWLREYMLQEKHRGLFHLSRLIEGLDRALEVAQRVRVEVADLLDADLIAGAKLREEKKLPEDSPQPPPVSGELLLVEKEKAAVRPKTASNFSSM
jgi:hypothetical protein